MEKLSLLNTSDHDLIIELKVHVLDLKRKMDELSLSTNGRLEEHEQRIRIMEDMVLRVQPDERLKQIDRWVLFESRWKVYVSIISFVVGFILFILQRFLLNYLKL